MTTLNEAREAVYARWVANSPLPAGRYCFAGEDYDPGRNTSWCRVAVRHIPGGQSSLGPEGNRRYLRRALVLVQVFTESGKGERAGDLLAQQVRAIFEGKRFSGLRFTDGEVRETGTDGGRWQGHIAECRFDYQEIK